MQALSQRVHGNAALSVTESGRFSLVDQILQEDYTPASKPLPPKVPTCASPRAGATCMSTFSLARRHALASRHESNMAPLQVCASTHHMLASP